VLGVLGHLAEAEEKTRLSIDLARRVGDAPLEGQRLVALGILVAMRGRLDEAAQIRAEAAPIMAANPEPQAFHFMPYLDGFLALGRKDRSGAAEKFADAAEHLRDHSVDLAPEVVSECVRALMWVDDRARAETFRDLDASKDSVHSAAQARNVNGLLEPDPSRAADLLRKAVADFERLEMRLAAARAMVDLGRAMSRAGDDPREILARAREILTQCDARLFLFEVDEAVAELSLMPSAEQAG
jgi:hypothetical protein